MISDKELVKRCLDNDTAAQELLYRRFASKMFGVCLRYARNKIEAQDILQEGFIKVFSNLTSFRDEGSFEGWIRRIIVNTAITFYRKNLRIPEAQGNEDALFFIEDEQEDVLSSLSMQDLLEIIQSLPEGYRIVFNLYAIEGYSHQEIAELLGISVGTSKSQLARARFVLQQKIGKQKQYIYERRFQ